eukprot:CAMPEP_0202456452 /NCGR_PEP_ID=MMETSP1360-20130828/13700_1 /ASSEMBLY_ACC=CAM_ASM_000848 /TAXON_ID=515479 /ORGANISM="Licmophora paradoxa, Strain CCMP2313" /LENGTH=173 /DNA_ID=CAMNT_0049076255 /DNA_START=42 /DNA_END=566 /DNA_ORIENTATION=-
MAPAWEKLAKEWEDKPGLVADIDCTGAGRPLCKKHGVGGFPTLKYGDPADLEEYDGGRSYEDLIIFATEYLKPPCSPLNTDLCDAEMKKVIDDYKAMDTSELLDLVDQEEEKLADVVAKYEKEVEKLQQAYGQLTKEKEDAIEAARGEGLDLLKPVIAFKKKIEAARLGKDEL